MTVWLVWVGPRLNSVHATENLAEAHKTRLLEVNGDDLPVRCESIEVRQ